MPKAVCWAYGSTDGGTDAPTPRRGHDPGEPLKLGADGIVVCRRCGALLLIEAPESLPDTERPPKPGTGA